MTDATRRGFLAAAGAGAVTVAAVAAAPGAAADLAAGGSDERSRTSEPLVAYVADTRTGDVALMVGEDEVVVTDRDLVARLTRAARR